MIHIINVGTPAPAIAIKMHGRDDVFGDKGWDFIHGFRHTNTNTRYVRLVDPCITSSRASLSVNVT
jgi:hypothetical protein